MRASKDNRAIPPIATAAQNFSAECSLFEIPLEEFSLDSRQTLKGQATIRINISKISSITKFYAEWD